MRLADKLTNGLLHRQGQNKKRKDKKEIKYIIKVVNFFLRENFCNNRKVKKVIGIKIPNILNELVRAEKKPNKNIFLLLWKSTSLVKKQKFIVTKDKNIKSLLL